MVDNPSSQLNLLEQHTPIFILRISGNKVDLESFVKIPRGVKPRCSWRCWLGIKHQDMYEAKHGAPSDPEGQSLVQVMLRE